MRSKELMDAHVKLFLLGPFRAERAGQRVTDFKSNKVRALLIYLAIERDTIHHRDVLATLLWPESSHSNALALLRDVLSNLRLVLGDRDAETPIIQVQADTLQITPPNLKEAMLWLDTAAFSTLTTKAADEEALEQAVSLYRGDFLEGFTLAHNPEFEAWTLLQRENFRRKMLDTLYHLTTLYLQRGDYTAAQLKARSQLALDFYSEESHRQLLRALALNGQRNQALAHYIDYAERLNAELGVEPDIRTTALYQSIRDGRLQPTDLDSLSLSSIPPGLFVGREEELAWLETRLQRAQKGTGQVAFVIGDAGSGKTTLIRALTHRTLARADSVVVAGGACNAQIGTGDPYLPFREILRLLSGDLNMQTASGALAPDYAQQLEKFAPTFVQALVKEGPDLIGSLVSLDPEIAEWTDPESVELTDGKLIASRRAPQSQAALCDQVTRVLSTVSRQCVLVLVLDDLHWADSSTLNLLAHLGRRLAGSRILIIGAYRPTEIDTTHPLLSVVRELQRTHGDIMLDLNQAGGRAFVDAFLDNEPNTLGESFRAQLTRQTNGHALFTAALVQQMRDDEALVRDSEGCWTVSAELDWSHMPPRVEAVIAKRIARLPRQGQELLTVASVEGEVFTVEVIAEVLNQSTSDVMRELRDLGSGTLPGPHQKLVYALGPEQAERGSFSRYRFRHALFQQYLYTNLDHAQRTRIHAAVGRALETLHEEHLDTIAAQLAYHFEEAGLIEPAVNYLLQAGKQAYRLSAPTESVTLYQRGLALLEEMPGSERQAHLEMELLLNIEAPLMTTRGWGAPERVQSLQRAYRLGQRGNETTRLLPILQALASVHIARAEYHIALDYAEQLVSLAQATQNRFYAVIGQRMIGTGYLFLGLCKQALERFETVLQDYTELAPKALESGYVWAAEEGVRLRVWLSLLLTIMGYPERAAMYSEEALELAQSLDYVGVQAIALTTAGAIFHAFCRQPQATLHFAERLSALVTKHKRLPAYQGWAKFYRGWAISQHGQPEAGLSEMHAGWDQLKSTGTRSSSVHLFILLAECYARLGKIQAGEKAIEKALKIAEQTEGSLSLAEIYRVRGMLMLKKQAVEDAEASFMRAIETARGQAAKLWELRATMDLARLWAAQGRAAEAHARLSEVYDWFTEGLDTPDLEDARALLKALR